MDPFVIRPFADADFPRLVRLLAEAEAVDQSGEDVSEQTLRTQLEAPQHVAALDRWVIEHPQRPDQLIGHSVVWPSPASEDPRFAEMTIVVHPDWRRRGLGGELLARSLTRARDCQATHARIYADTRDQATTAFLIKHAFQPVAAYTELQAVTADICAQSELPTGYVVRPYRAIQQLSLLADAFNRGYAGLWGHHLITEAELARWLPKLDQDGLLLLFAPDGGLAGISRVECHAQRTERNGEPTGYIDGPGVTPEHRTAALYRGLLLHGVEWLRQRQQTRIELESWGDAAETLRLYEQVGFAVRRQQSTYHLTLAA